MNIQDILSFITVAFAFGYAIYSLVELLMPVRKKSGSNCGSCTICSEK